jgi:hypothetical protein
VAVRLSVGFCAARAKDNRYTTCSKEISSPPKAIRARVVSMRRLAT